MRCILSTTVVQVRVYYVTVTVYAPEYRCKAILLLYFMDNCYYP